MAGQAGRPGEDKVPDRVAAAANGDGSSTMSGGEPGEPIRGELLEKVVKIRRCAAVVKGGRRFSFAALVIVGDGKGRVGIGYGKANEVPPSVEKAFKRGSRSMIEVSLDGATIPHVVKGTYGAAEVVLVPAEPGTGVIAGAAVRAVCEAAGIHDILTKSYGSNNPIGLVKATLDALTSLRTRPEVERLRGVSLDMNLDDVHRGYTATASASASAAAPAPATEKPPPAATRGSRPARASSRKLVFEGGKMPLVRRIPKRGFNNRWAKIVAVVNVGDLERGVRRRRRKSRPRRSRQTGSRSFRTIA